MAGLFNESDFDLIAQYAGKKKKEVADATVPLKAVYNKLGKIIEGLGKLGYYTSIKKNPLSPGGRGHMKYQDYHWARVYPKQRTLKEECYDKVFFVVGTDAGGINIHIDSYSSKGYSSDNTEAKKR